MIDENHIEEDKKEVSKERDTGLKSKEKKRGNNSLEKPTMGGEGKIERVKPWRKKRNAVG